MKEINNLTIQIGRKAIGKTRYCKKLIESGIYRRVLVLDFHNEYEEVRKMSLKTCLKWSQNNKKGVNRVCFDKSDSDSYRAIIRGFRNGTMIIENPYFIWGGELPNDLMGMMACSRTKRVNLIINLNTVAEFSYPKLYRNTSFVNLYVTNENLERYKNRFMPYTYGLLQRGDELLNIARDSNGGSVTTRAELNMEDNTLMMIHEIKSK